MATYTQATTTLLPRTSIGASTIVKGTTVTVAGGISGKVYWREGRTTTTSLGTIGAPPEFHVEAGLRGGFYWSPISITTTQNHNVTASKQSLASNLASGAAALTVVTVTGFTGGERILIYNSGDVTKSEWQKILSVTSPVLTLLDTLEFPQTASTSEVFDQAEEWNVGPIDFTGVDVIRVLVDTAKNAVAIPFLAESWMVRATAFS